MDEETAGKMRGMIRRVVLKNVRDDGEMQRCSVEVAEGHWRDDVEIMQPYGFAAHVPEDGALGIVLTVGGDEGDLVVLPVANPSARMGGLKEGDVGVYNAGGDRMMMTAGGDLQIKTGATMTVKTGAQVTVETAADASVQAAGAVTITGASGHLA